MTPLTPKQRAVLSIVGNGLFILLVGGTGVLVLLGLSVSAPLTAIIVLLVIIAVILSRRPRAGR